VIPTLIANAFFMPVHLRPPEQTAGAPASATATAVEGGAHRV